MPASLILARFPSVSPGTARMSGKQIAVLIFSASAAVGVGVLLPLVRKRNVAESGLWWYLSRSLGSRACGPHCLCQSHRRSR